MEHPILFSGDMVKAVLAGNKTQTRRVIKPQPPHEYSEAVGPDWSAPKPCVFFCEAGKPLDGDVFAKCPYGVPGDRLWVLETHVLDYLPGFPQTPEHCAVHYMAGHESPLVWKSFSGAGCVRPSIFMPRWASRILLEVTDVRVERVQEIGIYDIRDEGLDISGLLAGFEIESEYAPGDDPEGFVEAAENQFQKVWDSINEKRGFGWDTNPWVWVISFKVAK